MRRCGRTSPRPAERRHEAGQSYISLERECTWADGSAVIAVAGSVDFDTPPASVDLDAFAATAAGGPQRGVQADRRQTLTDRRRVPPRAVGPAVRNQAGSRLVFRCRGHGADWPDRVGLRARHPHSLETLKVTSQRDRHRGPLTEIPRRPGRGADRPLPGWTRLRPAVL
ncbi:predicted protein [Streptomyces sp. C]|nr:predicted protein [Streptomyces sp. C]